MPQKRIPKPVTDFETKDGVIRATTMLKVEEMAKRISKGESKEKTIEYIMNKYGLSHGRCYDLYYEATKYLMPKDPERHREEIQALNTQRLNKIVDECMESKDWNNATKAIAELNKMGGVTSNGIKVGVRTDGDGNSEFVVQIQ